MKRWLPFALVPIVLLLLSVGVLAVRHAGGAGAEAVPGDSAACGAAQTDLDSRALIAALDASPLSDIAKASLAAKCYLVGIDVLRGGCGSGDLWVLRYLCYDPSRYPEHNGWYYVNYWYCDCDDPEGMGGDLDPDGWQSAYSFSHGSCSAQYRVDPITVVFWGATSAQQVEDHLADHTDWDEHTGNNQVWYTYGYCVNMDGHSNSEWDEGVIQGEQYHIRLWEGRGMDGDPDNCHFTHYVVGTPHHEVWDTPQGSCGSSYHSVYDNETHPDGGFNNARDNILDEWYPDHHYNWQWWGNNQLFRQSKGYGAGMGCWYARADGYVAKINIWHG